MALNVDVERRGHENGVLLQKPKSEQNKANTTPSVSLYQTVEPEYLTRNFSTMRRPDVMPLFNFKRGNRTTPRPPFNIRYRSLN